MEQLVEGVRAVALSRAAPSRVGLGLNTWFGQPELLMLYNAKLDTFSEPEPFAEKVKKVAKSGVHETHKLTILDEQLDAAIHYQFRPDTNVLYVAVTGKRYPQARAFQLLRKAVRETEGLYGAELSRVGPAQLNGDVELRNLLIDLCVEFRYDSRVAQVDEQLDEVKLVMQQNITAAMARGEKLEILQDKTEQMNLEAGEFNRSAAEVRNDFWRENMKLIAAISLATLILILILILVFTLR
ncbi:Vesicle-associated membrane protein [Porphyridium purpureum]|uniref:Vesicle-associated membrane protein n=1 Tax=Porphyridium purpureum TaxID=35688 RepID=A0A5J4Z300_PORPP|nr:Vesicle-associated membrane protein [Porphyridium purpureum]|eukprot:POR1605..scf208_2